MGSFDPGPPRNFDRFKSLLQFSPALSSDSKGQVAEEADKLYWELIQNAKWRNDETVAQKKDYEEEGEGDVQLLVEQTDHGGDR